MAFSKELLPVGSRRDGASERPRAVSEYLVERMVRAGCDRLCFVIAPGKGDILAHFGEGYEGATAAYVVQPRPAGLCDALFRALPLIGDDEPVIVGLPDTIWCPEHALRQLPDDRFSFLLFPVEDARPFDAVVTDGTGRVARIQVKAPDPATQWIWGAFKLPGRTLRALHRFWQRRDPPDEYVGTLVQAWLEAGGGEAWGVPAGRAYVDVGTVHGYRTAVRLLGGAEAAP